MHAAAFFFQSASDIIQRLTIIINVAKQTINSVCIIVNRMASGWEGKESSQLSHCAWLLFGERESKTCYGRLPCCKIKKVKTVKWDSLQHMMVIWDTTSSTTTLVQQK
jgi:hypothetical protein